MEDILYSLQITSFPLWRGKKRGLTSLEYLLGAKYFIYSFSYQMCIECYPCAKKKKKKTFRLPRRQSSYFHSIMGRTIHKKWIYNMSYGNKSHEKKIKHGKMMRVLFCDGRWGVVMEGLPDKMTFEQRPKKWGSKPGRNQKEKLGDRGNSSANALRWEPAWCVWGQSDDAA